MAVKKPPQPSPAGETPEQGALGFEQALERLETIVSQLEEGSLSLEDSLARYEEGVKLSQQLTHKLDEAERRIERLVEEGGQPVTQPLELDLQSPGSRAEEDESSF
jgi:exodeoxyribonuclease VII small subunit